MSRVVVEVKISVVIPKEATGEQIEEWLKYRTGLVSEIGLENPLCDSEMESRSFEIL